MTRTAHLVVRQSRQSRHRLPAMVAVLLGLSLQAGCGGAGEAMPQRISAPDDPARTTAVAVAQGLAAAGIGVQGVVACRPPAPAPSGHPRPHAAAFDDSHIGTTDPRHVLREGGVVEVLGSRAEVRQRLHELDQQSIAAQEYGFDEGGRALHQEHTVTRGVVLLRLSGELSRARVAAYRRALRHLVPATGIPDRRPTSTAEEAPCST